jgi:hypothetical protein
MDSQLSLFEHAMEACRKTWPRTLCSSFHMFEVIVQLSGKTWEEFVQIPRFDKSSMKHLEKRIRQSPDDELRKLWVEHHGLCTSWSILIASMLFDDPNTMLFGDDGSHRLAYTSHGLIIDSSTRIPVLLKGDKAYTKGGITYSMSMVEGQQPSLSYTVCLLFYTHELP